MTLFGWRRGEAWKAQRRPRTRVLASGVTTLAVERRNERHAQDASERLPVLWRMSRRFCRGCERSPERIRRRQVDHWRGRWKIFGGVRAPSHAIDDISTGVDFG